MSWEIMIVHLRDRKWRHSLQAPDVHSLGSKIEVQQKLTNVLPAIEWGTEARPDGKSQTVGHLDSAELTLEFYGLDSEQNKILHVEGHGGGNLSQVLRLICDKYGWSVIELCKETGFRLREL